jgi:hypothetical protein
MEVLILALLSAASLLIILSKTIGFMRVVKHHKIVDVLATVGLPLLFFGSFAGMATAIIAGVMLSLILWTASRLMQL